MWYLCLNHNQLTYLIVLAITQFWQFAVSLCHESDFNEK